MKKMNSSELTNRINRFMDRNRAKLIDVSELAEGKARRSHRQLTEVSDSPFIALAIK